MRVDIMTLFPDMVSYILGESIIGRAQKSGTVEINTYNIRDYSEDKHRRVDDTPYGGGKGMLMMAPPIYNCYSAILNKQAESGFEIYFSNLKAACTHVNKANDTEKLMVEGIFPPPYS